MLCEICKKKMYIHREKVLDVSGIKRTLMRCQNRHTQTLLEGVKVPPLGRNYRLEQPQNGNAYYRLRNGMTEESDLAWLGLLGKPYSRYSRLTKSFERALTARP